MGFETGDAHAYRFPGGTGTAFTGHGRYVPGSGNISVPEGSAITLPRDGIRILDETGRYIEAGDWDGLARAAAENPRIANDIEGMATRLAGTEIPNYFGRLNKQENFSFTLFLRSVNPKLEKSMGERMALRNPRIKWIDNDLAKALRSEGRGILLGEDKVFNDMEGLCWWDVES